MVVILKEKKFIVKALTIYCNTKTQVSFECLNGLIPSDHYAISLLH